MLLHVVLEHQKKCVIGVGGLHETHNSMTCFAVYNIIPVVITSRVLYALWG